MSEKTTECRAHRAVQDGCCLIVRDGESIIYVGPINKAPNFDEFKPGTLVYLSPKDLEVLRAAGMHQ
jgi:hypothetical protein